MAEDYEQRRAAMVEEQLAGRDVKDAAVLRAMREVPREAFVPADQRDLAFEDHPLPIGHGQTISQPYIVGLTCQALELAPGLKVLDVGCGSGYQAAVLAELGADVWATEVVAELAESAAARLEKLDYGRVRVRHTPGVLGWPDAAPFDRIACAAEAGSVPTALLDQLAEGGVAVLPVAGRLMRYRRRGGAFDAHMICPATFVPLVEPEDTRGEARP